MNVSVIGLGKLGAVLAAVLASSGHEVIGVDLFDETVDAVNRLEAPVAEPGLQDLISSLRFEMNAGLTATTEYADAIPHSDISMIVVPTPSRPDGTFNPVYVEAAVEEIARNLPDRWHTVVVCSTLMPGSMDNDIKPLLESISGRRVGESIGLCYSPEFIALGSVIKDMLEPDSILVGCEDQRSARELRELVDSYVRTKPAFHELSFREAELAKISVNAFVTMKISYANTIAAFAERLEGANASKVLAAVGADRRIGHNYLRPGASFGGPCFPRDNRAFASLGEELGLDAHLAVATDATNEDLIARVGHLLGQYNRVAILGLSYKPGTPVVEESMGLSVATNLARAGVRVAVHDPEAQVALPAEIERYDDVYDALAGADVVLVATPWSQYTTIDFLGRLIVDAWGCTMPQPNRRVLGVNCDWWHA